MIGLHQNRLFYLQLTRSKTYARVGASRYDMKPTEKTRLVNTTGVDMVGKFQLEPSHVVHLINYWTWTFLSCRIAYVGLFCVNCDRGYIRGIPRKISNWTTLPVTKIQTPILDELLFDKIPTIWFLWEPSGWYAWSCWI